MVAKNFENGDLVWAKMKGYPPWPGKITNPPKETKTRKGHHYVLFYDSNNYAWIHDDAIEFHSESLVNKYTKGHKRPPSYLNAVQLIMAASKNKPKTTKVSEKANEESTDQKRKNTDNGKNKGVKKVSSQANDNSDASEGKNGSIKSTNLKIIQKSLPDKERKNAVKRVNKKSRLSAESDISNSEADKNQKSETFIGHQKTKKSFMVLERKQKSSDFSVTDKQLTDKITIDKEQDDTDQICKIGTSDDENGEVIVDFRREDIDEINAADDMKYEEVSLDKSKTDELPVSSKLVEATPDQVDRDKTYPELSDTEREIKSEINTIQQLKNDDVSLVEKSKNGIPTIKKKRKGETNKGQNDEALLVKKQRKSIAADNQQEEPETDDVEMQTYNEIKSKKEQKSIRLGLSRSQKSSALSIPKKHKNDRETAVRRLKNYEPSTLKKVKNVTGTKKLRNEASVSNIHLKSESFPNLILSERAESLMSEAMEDSSILHRRPESPSLDLNSENEILKLKNVTPTKKKIGFLGLGSIGQRIVKNLIQSGHSVMVWNRTESVCDNFVGAEKAKTPSEVIMSCDIIFSCLANTLASKTVFFGNCGIAVGLRDAAITGERKGYVEMTTIDPEISKAIHLEVNLKGGRYLEAQLTGSKEQASEGNLLIVAAGDKSLFDDCQSCFVAIGKTSMLVSDQVGVASMYNMVHNTLYGTVYAALAESLALVDSIGLDKDVFINSFMYPKIKTVVHLDKNHVMGKSDCPVNTPLIHVQKSLNAAVSLGSSVAQPMHVNSAANEVYKHCKLLKFQNRDISAVYEAARR